MAGSFVQVGPSWRSAGAGGMSTGTHPAAAAEKTNMFVTYLFATNMFVTLER
jgi:curli biogenesis system outer membrane secretion channel CsgG